MSQTTVATKHKIVKVQRVRVALGGADAMIMMNLWRACLGINRGERVTNDKYAWGNR